MDRENMNYKNHPMMTLAARDRATQSERPPTAAAPAPLVKCDEPPRRAVKITLILLRDAFGSALFLPPMQRISDKLTLVPALLATPAEIRAMREAALRLAAAHGFKGALVFQFALSPENSEFLVLEATAALTLENHLMAHAVRYAVAGVALQLELGQSLSGAVNARTGLSAALMPRPDCFAVCDGTRIHYGANLPAAVMPAMGQRILTQSGADKAMHYALDILSAARRELTAGCRAVHINRARKWGFSDAQIKRLCGRPPKKQPDFAVADAAFGTSNGSGPLYLTHNGRNEAQFSAKPRLLLIGGPVEKDPHLCGLAAEARRKGYEISLMSPEVTAADIDRHYVTPLTEESKKAVLRAERPQWVEE